VKGDQRFGDDSKLDIEEEQSEQSPNDEADVDVYFGPPDYWCLVPSEVDENQCRGTCNSPGKIESNKLLLQGASCNIVPTRRIWNRIDGNDRNDS